MKIWNTRKGEWPFVIGTLVVVLIVALVSGCGVLAPRTTEAVTKAVNLYCDEPAAARQLYRDTINTALAADGHTITLTCAGDP